MNVENPFHESANKKPVGTNNVEDFLSALDHPLKQEILALREIILNSDPSIGEDIKWNVPSFFTKEFFATFHLRGKDSVQVILHFGAKKREEPIQDDLKNDPESLLNWLGKDRASVKFSNMNEVFNRKAAFENILRQWIRHV